eukprot:5102373-Amphidinium_carterae.1
MHCTNAPALASLAGLTEELLPIACWPSCHKTCTMLVLARFFKYWQASRKTSDGHQKAPASDHLCKSSRSDYPFHQIS